MNQRNGNWQTCTLYGAIVIIIALRFNRSTLFIEMVNRIVNIEADTRPRHSSTALLKKLWLRWGRLARGWALLWRGGERTIERDMLFARIFARYYFSVSNSAIGRLGRTRSHSLRPVAARSSTAINVFLCIIKLNELLQHLRARARPRFSLPPRLDSNAWRCICASRA